MSILAKFSIGEKKNQIEKTFLEKNKNFLKKFQNTIIMIIKFIAIINVFIYARRKKNSYFQFEQ